jgi:Fur family peroxide stress response transcriptional regulator
MQALNNIIVSLRNKGFRITPQRVAIINYLLNSQIHPTAEEICKAVQRKYPMMSMATVYKTVDFLKNMGIIQELCFAGEVNRYDANISKHVNVVCIRCKRIEDIDEQQSLSLLESRVSDRSRYQIFGGRFELYGYCNNCKNKKT